MTLRLSPAGPGTHDVPASRFPRVGERLWLDFINTEDTRRGQRIELLPDFDALVEFLTVVGVVDGERAASTLRRARQQPAGATAALIDARRGRTALRALAERGATSDEARFDALTEINRMLGRSAVIRRIDEMPDGTFAQRQVPVGDAFAALILPVIESAADAFTTGELHRVRRCGDPRCSRVFFDDTRNGRRRWCEMATCGNRAKAARWRGRHDGDAA